MQSHTVVDIGIGSLVENRKLGRNLPRINVRKQSEILPLDGFLQAGMFLSNFPSLVFFPFFCNMFDGILIGLNVGICRICKSVHARYTYWCIRIFLLY